MISDTIDEITMENLIIKKEQDRRERIRKKVKKKMKKKIIVGLCLLGIILLSGCTDNTPPEEKCVDACSRIELEQPPQGDYFIRGIWNENTQTCTCKTFVESEPTFKIDISD